MQCWLVKWFVCCLSIKLTTVRAGCNAGYYSVTINMTSSGTLYAGTSTTYRLYAWSTPGTASTFSTNIYTPVDVFLVGGGGSGGSGGGGGGAGGVVYSTSVTMPPGTYKIYVGAGGLGVSVGSDGPWPNGNAGGDSYISTSTRISDAWGSVAYGGGGGGSRTEPASGTSVLSPGLAGGSSGGGGGAGAGASAAATQGSTYGSAAGGYSGSEQGGGGGAGSTGKSTGYGGDAISHPLWFNGANSYIARGGCSFLPTGTSYWCGSVFNGQYSGDGGCGGSIQQKSTTYYANSAFSGYNTYPTITKTGAGAAGQVVLKVNVAGANGDFICKLCPTGFYCPAGAVQPSACASWYQCAAGTAVPLSTCFAGTYMPSNIQTCIACSAGWYSLDYAISCSHCPAGNYCPDSTTAVLACPTGSYCPFGSSTFTSCPESTYSAAEGASTCSPCPAGSYCAGLGTVTPVQCPVGSYCPIRSATFTSCSASTYSAAEGASNCSSCPAGSYCAGLGTVDPVLCPVGSYCPFGSGAFTSCSATTYSAAEGSSTCSSCPAGSYCAGLGTVAPVTCLAGSYCPISSSTFTSCPVSTYSAIQGAVSVGNCSWCPAGSYCPRTGLSVALLCPAGSYCPFNSSAFISCPAASYTVLPGASSVGNCSWCTAGSYCPGNATMLLCPIGSYCVAHSSVPMPCPPRAYSGSGSVSCSWCPTGSYCPGNAAALGCPTGNVCPFNSSAPIPCTAGTSVVSNACVNCSVGSYSDALATSCSLCAAGSYTDSQQSASCKLCPVASYAASAGRSGCLSCSIGTVASTGSSGCASCGAGTYPSDMGSACVLCPIGTYSVAIATTRTCLTCAAMSGDASLLPQVGATSCAYCPASASFYSTDSTHQGACVASSAYGNITSTNGNYWMVHLFTSSVPYVTFTRNVVADVILIGGGGRGGGVSSVGNSMPYGTYGGGGGGGTVVMYAGFQFNTSAVYSMTVGGSGQASTIYADSVPLFVAQPGGKGGDGVYNGDVVAVRGGQGGGGGGGCYNCTAAPGGGASQGNIVAGVSGLRTGCSANFSAGTLLPTQGSYYIGHAVGSDGQASNKMDVAYTAGYSSPGIRSPGILLGDGGSGYNYSDCGSLWEPCMTYLGTVYDSTAKSIVRAICGPTIPLFTNPFVTGVSQGGPGWLFHIDLKYSVNTDYPPNINSGSGGHGGRGYDYENGASGAIILRYTSITAQFPCAAGLFLLTQPIVTCAICLPGTFSLYNSTACTPCPLNTYNNIVQASSCTACPTNLMTPVVGGTRCCASPGYYLNSTGGANPCPANSFC